MRRILVLLIAVIVCAEVAQAGDVKVEAVTTASPGGEGTTNFAPDVPELFAMFKTKGAQSGDKLRGVWIAEDVGSAAPANSKIDEKTLTMDGDTDDGDLSLSKPTKGWPVGKYRFEIYVNDKLVTTTRFTIEGNKEEESAESTNSSGLSGGQRTQRRQRTQGTRQTRQIQRRENILLQFTTQRTIESRSCWRRRTAKIMERLMLAALG